MPDDNTERDTLLLETLMGVVPNSHDLALYTNGAVRNESLRAMLAGYGTLLNIIQAASELADVGDLHARLAAAYYELTNTDPAALTDEIKLHDDDEED